MSNIHTFDDIKVPKKSTNKYGFGNSPAGRRATITSSNDADNSVSDSTNGWGLVPGATSSSAIERVFPKYNTKAFTFGVSIMQVLIFVITEIWSLSLQNNQSHKRSFYCVLYKSGAKFTPSITDDYQYYRLIAPIFLHAGVIHFIFNMLSQNMIGYTLEEHYGRTKFVALYFISGVSGNLLSAVMTKDDISVGASSPLFGIFALNIAFIIQNYDAFGGRKKAVLLSTVLIILVNFFGASDSVDTFAHIGLLIHF